MTAVMVLCAGLGTRLSALTQECPKPLVPVGDRPQLVHLLDQVARAGLASALINTHHHAAQFEALGTQLRPTFTQRRFGLEVSFEPELLGTAGGVHHARERLEAPLVVWNGDIWIEPPLQALLASAAAPDAVCLLAGPSSDGAPGSGTLGLDAQGQVVRLRGERFGAELRGAQYLGVMALGSRALQLLPAKGCLIADLCLPYLRRGGTITTLAHAGPWFDIGSLAGYRDANFHWLERVASKIAHVASDAVVAAGTAVAQSIVGAGAELTGRGAVLGSIVWPGARAELPLVDVVVTSSGRRVPLPLRGGR